MRDKPEIVTAARTRAAHFFVIFFIRITPFLGLNLTANSKIIPSMHSVEPDVSAELNPPTRPRKRSFGRQ